MVAGCVGPGSAVDAVKAQVPELTRQCGDEKTTIQVLKGPDHFMPSMASPAARMLDVFPLSCPIGYLHGRRLYVISKCRRLKVLDFRKVKQKV